MKNERECPYCSDNTVAKLTNAQIKVTFKGVEYEITQHFYKCEKCEIEFEDEESMTETLKQIPNYPT